MAARKLHRRQARAQSETFLAEGPQAVGEALAAHVVLRLMLTARARDRFPQLLTAVERAAGVSVVTVSESAADALATTVTPQGVFAVCRALDRPWRSVLEGRHTLGAMLLEDRDPGNVGTIMRTADAVGADALLLSTGSVDVYNPKTVRASAGSVFHVPHAVDVDSADALETLRDRGVRVLAADARGTVSLPEMMARGGLAEPTMWLFGSEAHGVPEATRALAHASVRLPIYGSAESLNVAAAAAVCLYASAFVQRGALRFSGAPAPTPGGAA